MRNNGVINVASIVPKEVAIGDVQTNTKNICSLITTTIKQTERGIHLMVFPELCLTGYTCGDLFNQSLLHDEVMDAIIQMTYFIKKLDYAPIIVVGAPIRKDNQLFNCAVVFSKDGLLGIVPKTFIPNYNEFYEARHFASGLNRLTDTITIEGKEYPFTTDILFEDSSTEMVLGVEICEDLWVPNPPSIRHCMNGANVIANLSGSNETIGKKKYREDLVRMHTATNACAYVYTSAGTDESTSDTVFSGHSIIACNGSIQASVNDLNWRENAIIEQVDLEKCMNDRMRMNSYMGMVEKTPYLRIQTKTILDRTITGTPSMTPFVPKTIDERAEEILTIQANGLAQRLKKIGLTKVVIGISGGLDSTLALIVAVDAFKKLHLPMKGIIGITMPAFGTTDRTKNNSVQLMEALGITSMTIDIKKMCDAMYKGMNHDKSLLDITFENVQARTRTEILMNMANKEGGIVIGTGDLSELALGWCTYNGDHMSMYAVNSSIPKTLVRYLVKYYAEKRCDENVKPILLDICDTPISPELLPPNADGTIAQKTEESIGSYIMHDFTLYYMMRFGYSPAKICTLWVNSMFADYEKNNITFDHNAIRKQFYQEMIANMKTFYKRFFSQQFKRNCMPDGVKVGSISLSPRADWRMPSDGTAKMWMEELDIMERKYK